MAENKRKVSVGKSSLEQRTQGTEAVLDEIRTLTTDSAVRSTNDNEISRTEPTIGFVLDNNSNAVKREVPENLGRLENDTSTHSLKSDHDRLPTENAIKAPPPASSFNANLSKTECELFETPSKTKTDLAIRTSPKESNPTDEMARTEINFKPTENNSLPKQLNNVAESDADEDGVAERESWHGNETSKTETNDISLRSFSRESNERAHRSPRTGPNEEPKTEKLGEIADEKNGSRGRSERMYGAPFRKTLTGMNQNEVKKRINERCSTSADEYQTGCQTNRIESEMNVNEHPIVSENRRTVDVWSLNFKELLKKFWVPRNSFVKALIVIWFCISIFSIIKIGVTFVNAYVVDNFDDCHSVNLICKRFGLACFTRCGITRWSVFWYRVVGD